MAKLQVRTFEIKDRKPFKEAILEAWYEDIKDNSKMLISSKVKAKTRPSMPIERTLYYIELDKLGENFEFHRHLLEMKEANPKSAFEGQVCGIIVRSCSVDFTKPFLKKTLYAINQMGGTFIGHPTIELLPELENFETWSKSLKADRAVVAVQQLDKLIERLDEFRWLTKPNLKVLALHAGRQDMSTSLKLWHQIKERIEVKMPEDLTIKELHVDEGKIYDCYGCPYETCLYFAKDRKCFYGGTVVEDLFPALEEADVVLWICPNYNDSVSAKLMAVINRMTALYRHMSFNDKYISAIIVSGNSGSDTVAGQLINALAINKGFRLWPYFAMSLIANHPNDLIDNGNVEKAIVDYVDTMHKNTYKNISKS